MTNKIRITSALNYESYTAMSDDQLRQFIQNHVHDTLIRSTSSEPSPGGTPTHRPNPLQSAMPLHHHRHTLQSPRAHHRHNDLSAARQLPSHLHPTKNKERITHAHSHTPAAQVGKDLEAHHLQRAAQAKEMVLFQVQQALP